MSVAKGMIINMEELKVNKNPGLFARINANQPNLRGAEKKVTNFIEKKYEEIIHLSITEVAERSQSSESSIVRLCKKLGYKGFQDMKINLAKEIISPEKQIHEVIEKNDNVLTVKKKVFQSNIQALYDSLEVCDDEQLLSAVKAISKADLIEFYGTGGSGTVALDAQHKLLKLGVKSFAYIDSTLQSMSASVSREKDVVVGISHTGANKEVLHAMELAKESGSTLICITSSSKSPITQISDILLQTASNETLFRTDAISSRIAQLTIIDILVAALATNNYEESYENLKKTRKSTSEKKF